jgi:GrpB-like predicted nucleotidyltransferase (UPF0157 family)
MSGANRTTEQEAMREAEIQAATVGKVTRLTGPILLVDYDPEWPRMFQREAERIRAALGDRALMVEHAGSTSVPGLAAKPRIDILLTVADPADEASYVPAMESAGYVLRIREPDWYEHRMFNSSEIDLNLHVLPHGCDEIDRMLGFRDHLRRNEADRQLYERTKRELVQREWRYMQDYTDAKSQVIEEIIARAMRSGDGDQPGCNAGTAN